MTKKYQLALTLQAARMFKKLPPEVKPVCRKALEKIEKDPLLGKNLLFALKGYYSFRTSAYRIIYRISKGRVEVVVVAVGHRREVYDRLRKLLGL